MIQLARTFFLWTRLQNECLRIKFAPSCQILCSYSAIGWQKDSFKLFAMITWQWFEFTPLPFGEGKQLQCAVMHRALLTVFLWWFFMLVFLGITCQVVFPLATFFEGLYSFSFFRYWGGSEAVVFFSLLSSLFHGHSLNASLGYVSLIVWMLVPGIRCPARLNIWWFGEVNVSVWGHCYTVWRMRLIYHGNEVELDFKLHQKVPRSWQFKLVGFGRRLILNRGISKGFENETCCLFLCYTKARLRWFL